MATWLPLRRVDFSLYDSFNFVELRRVTNISYPHSLRHKLFQNISKCLATWLPVRGVEICLDDSLDIFTLSVTWLVWDGWRGCVDNLSHFVCIGQPSHFCKFIQMKKASGWFFVQIGSIVWDLNKNYKSDGEGLSHVKIFGFSRHAIGQSLSSLESLEQLECLQHGFNRYFKWNCILRK